MPAGNVREAQVIYKELLKEIEKLGYREKLHLAQRLLQMAIKEEEEQKPESAGPIDPGMVEFVAERLRKLKPSRKDAVLNSIGAMFQFRGGISERGQGDDVRGPRDGAGDCGFRDGEGHVSGDVSGGARRVGRGSDDSAVSKA